MSFVSENNSLSGYKPCIEAEMSHKWLRHGSIQDSRVIIALPILKTPSS